MQLVLRHLTRFSGGAVHEFSFGGYGQGVWGRKFPSRVQQRSPRGVPQKLKQFADVVYTFWLHTKTIKIWQFHLLIQIGSPPHSLTFIGASTVCTSYGLGLSGNGWAETTCNDGRSKLYFDFRFLSRLAVSSVCFECLSALWVCLHAKIALPVYELFPFPFLSFYVYVIYMVAYTTKTVATS